MVELKHKVRCATCGKRERIKIVNRRIPKNWYYFGKINVNACQMSKYLLTPKDQNHPLDDLIKIPNSCYDPKAKRELVECWICRECADKEDKGIRG